MEPIKLDDPHTVLRTICQRILTELDSDQSIDTLKTFFSLGKEAYKYSTKLDMGPPILIEYKRHTPDSPDTSLIIVTYDPFSLGTRQGYSAFLLRRTVDLKRQDFPEKCAEAVTALRRNLGRWIIFCDLKGTNVSTPMYSAPERWQLDEQEFPTGKLILTADGKWTCVDIESGAILNSDWFGELYDTQQILEMRSTDGRIIIPNVRFAELEKGVPSWSGIAPDAPQPYAPLKAFLSMVVVVSSDAHELMKQNFQLWKRRLDNQLNRLIEKAKCMHASGLIEIRILGNEQFIGKLDAIRVVREVGDGPFLSDKRKRALDNLFEGLEAALIANAANALTVTQQKDAPQNGVPNFVTVETLCAECKVMGDKRRLLRQALYRAKDTSKIEFRVDRSNPLQPRVQYERDEAYKIAIRYVTN